MPPASDLVDDLARLAALTLDPQARASLEADLRRIIAYVDQLRAVDCSDLDEHDLSDAKVQPLRSDEVGPSLPRSSFLPPAPRSAGAFFAVPSWRDLEAD
jgi:aspartyl-tRNA(Asn)/glutamyl-tRNA(Gln) amidotransferase subunit C